MNINHAARPSFFNRFYRVMLWPGLILYVITGFITLTSALQPDADPNFDYPLWIRLAGAGFIGPTSIILGWFVARRMKDSLIGPVLIHWGCATNAELGLGYLPAFWGALSLDYQMIVVLPGLILMLACFPTGRGVTPRWDRVMKGLILTLMGIGLLVNLSGPIAYGLTSPSPLAFARLYPIFPMVDGIYAVLFPASFVLAGALTVYRYRIARAAERKQMRWLLVLALGFLLVIAFTTNLDYPTLSEFEKSIISALGLVFFALPSVTISLAILFHRLWDIDVLIRRTLQYSLLSGLLALVYFTLVVVLQGFFTTVSGQASAITTVLSTLAIAALFLPLRRRAQNFIDKRFFRQHYDAQKVLAEFAATCRDETDLDQLTTRLVGVMHETMQPEGVTVWLKRTSALNRPGTEAE